MSVISLISAKIEVMFKTFSPLQYGMRQMVDLLQPPFQSKSLSPETSIPTTSLVSFIKLQIQMHPEHFLVSPCLRIRKEQIQNKLLPDL